MPQLLQYVIPLNPVTKKNSQRLVRTKSGRVIPLPSAAYQAYHENAAWYLNPKPGKPIETPCNVRCLFYMGTRRKTDLTNLLEAVDDILVDCGILADDNYSIVAGHDGSRCLYDKDNPRTVIEIRELDGGQDCVVGTLGCQCPHQADTQ